MSEEQKKTKRRVRSTAYPYFDLGKSVEMAKILFDREGRNAIPVSIAAEYMGYDPDSSRGNRAVSALLQFGLLSQEGQKSDRRVRLTNLALNIIESRVTSGGKGNLEFLRQSVMKPRIIKYIWDTYAEDGNLPSDKVLQTRFVMDDEITVNKSTFNTVMTRVRDSLAYAEVNGSTNDGGEVIDEDYIEGDDLLDEENGGEVDEDIVPPNGQSANNGGVYTPPPGKIPSFTHTFPTGEASIILPDGLTETELLKQWFALVISTIEARNK